MSKSTGKHIMALFYRIDAYLLIVALNLFIGSQSGLANGINSKVDGATQVTFGEIAEMTANYSPDKKWIAFEYFYQEGKGLPQLWLMPANGVFSQARPLAHDKKNAYAGMSWSPDSKWIAYVKNILTEEEQQPFYKKGESHVQIWKMNIVTGEQFQISHFPLAYSFEESKITWLPSGDCLAYVEDCTIYCIPADGGEPSKLVAIDVANTPLESISWLSISPDGRKFLFEAKEKNTNDHSFIYTVTNQPIAKPKRLTNGPYDGFPAWGPDSKHFCYTSGVENPPTGNILVGSLDSSTKPIRITTTHVVDFAPNWHPDGSKIVFCRNLNWKEKTTGSTIWEGFHIWEINIPHEAYEQMKRP